MSEVENQPESTEQAIGIRWDEETKQVMMDFPAMQVSIGFTHAQATGLGLNLIQMANFPPVQADAVTG